MLHTSKPLCISACLIRNGPWSKELKYELLLNDKYCSTQRKKSFVWAEIFYVVFIQLRELYRQCWLLPPWTDTLLFKTGCDCLIWIWILLVYTSQVSSRLSPAVALCSVINRTEVSISKRVPFLHLPLFSVWMPPSPSYQTPPGKCQTSVCLL